MLTEAEQRHATRFFGRLVASPEVSTMTIRSLLLPAAAAALALMACGMDSGTSGAMGQSSATPDCAPSDTNCLEDGLDAPVAVGARLPVDVRITAKGVSSPKMTL